MISTALIAWISLCPMKDEVKPTSSLILTAEDFVRIPGLEKAVNSPQFADRPIVRIHKGKIQIVPQFKPYRFVDAQGTVLKFVPASSWLHTYAALAQGETVRGTLHVPITKTQGLSLAWKLQGSPQEKPLFAFQRANVQFGSQEIVGEETVEKLAARIPGLSLLLAKADVWDGPPRIDSGVLRFHLRPVQAAGDRGFTWKPRWEDPARDTLLSAITWAQGKPVTVGFDLYPPKANKAALKVEKVLKTHPAMPVTVSKGWSIHLNGKSLGKGDTLEDLPKDADTLWHPNYSQPARLTDAGILQFSLKPWTFVDVRGSTITATKPESGWMRFYTDVRSGKRASLSFDDELIPPLKDVLLPPPTKYEVSEPAVGILKDDGKLAREHRFFICSSTKNGHRTLPLLRRGHVLFFAKKSDRTKDVQGTFLGQFAQDQNVRSYVCRTTAREGSPRSVWIPDTFKDLNALPLSIACPPEARLILYHAFPQQMGYRAREHDPLLSESNGQISFSGQPVDLRFVHRLEIKTSGGSYSISPPHSAGGIEAVMEGRIEPAFVRWWKQFRLVQMNNQTHTLLLVDGSVPGTRRFQQRLQELETWTEALDSIQKKHGQKVLIEVVTDKGFRSGKGGWKSALDRPEGSLTLRESSTLQALRNRLAVHPKIGTFLILASQDNLAVGRDLISFMKKALPGSLSVAIVQMKDPTPKQLITKIQSIAVR